MKPGVYVHIPFCEQRCYYCAFTIAVAPEQTYEPYVQRLIREIELSGFDEAPETIFFGGGTPSLVNGALIERILASLPRGAAEISLEANPGTLTDPKLEQYRQAGVNRISLGAQSFCDEDLKNAGRLHNSADVLRDIALLRKNGLNNISVDLIAGLPHQRKEVWRENMRVLEDLHPEHVSIYMLDVEERSAWGKSGRDIPNDDVFVGLYMEAAECLARAGYVHYEISNWAQPGFECRHNLKYWTGVPYRGFGVGAHSYSLGSDESEGAGSLGIGESSEAASLGSSKSLERPKNSPPQLRRGEPRPRGGRGWGGVGPLRHSFDQHHPGASRHPSSAEGWSFACRYPKRFWNTSSLAEYAQILDAGHLPIAGGEHLTREIQLEEAFLIGLRRTCGFDIWHVAGELGVTYPQSWFDRVGELEDAGWIQFDGKFLRLTPSGWMLANGVTEELLWPTLLSTSEATQ
jgi:oxygen-independent coproporphyrinogen-3 oxidase